MIRPPTSYPGRPGKSKGAGRARARRDGQACQAGRLPRAPCAPPRAARFAQLSWRPASPLVHPCSPSNAPYPWGARGEISSPIWWTGDVHSGSKFALPPPYT